jgi:hypothetical protein
MCSSSIDVSYFEKFDIQHMHGKFPHASGYLIERLGQANTAETAFAVLRKAPP